MLGFRLLPAAGELLLEGLLFFLLDRLGGKLLERLSHHIHIPAFEEDEIARRLLRGVFLERVVDPVLVRCTLERLDVSVGHFDVADCGVLLDKVLDGLLAPVGLGLRGLLFGLFNFLNEFGERLFSTSAVILPPLMAIATTLVFTSSCMGTSFLRFAGQSCH